MILPHVQQRTAVVTGAASGLGAAMARYLATAGFQVAVTDRNLQQAKHCCSSMTFLPAVLPPNWM